MQLHVGQCIYGRYIYICIVLHCIALLCTMHTFRGSRQIGPRTVGPRGPIIRAQLSVPKKRTIGPRTVGPRDPTVCPKNLDSWAPDGWALGPDCPGHNCPGPNLPRALSEESAAVSPSGGSTSENILAKIWAQLTPPQYLHLKIMLLLSVGWFVCCMSCFHLL